MQFCKARLTLSLKNRLTEVLRRGVIEEKSKKSTKLTFEDFEIGKTLGEGKVGVVMMARHRKTGSLFALKKIPKEMIKSHLMVYQLAW